MKKKIFSKKNIIIAIIVIAVLAIGGFIFGSRGGSKTTYVTEIVQKKNIIETVSEVGTVQSPTQIDLNFNSAGTLQSKLVGVGDSVKAGQILAQLDSRSQSFQRDQAAANLVAARASLEKLVQGQTAADLAVAQAQVDQASAGFTSASDNLDKTLKSVEEEKRQAQNNLNDLQGLSAGTITTFEQSVISANTSLTNTKANYQKSIDNASTNLLNDIGAKLSVANSALDTIDGIVTDTDIKDTLSAKNRDYLLQTKSTYDQAQQLMTSANSSLSAAMAVKTQASTDLAGANALSCLKKTSESLNNLFNALENSSINTIVLDAYKTGINGQITLVNTAISIVSADQQNFDNAYLSYNTNVTTAQNGLNQAQSAWDNAITSAKNTLSSLTVGGDQKISAAQNSMNTARQSLAVAQKQLAQLKAPARAEDISLAQSKVADAQSALDLAAKQLEDSSLKAPIDGQIVKDNYQVGEQTSPATPVFSILEEGNLEISVDISESDIAKIMKDDSVEVTLDAFGQDQKFNGKVYFIDPASTIIQDVIYYRVKVKFTDAVEKLSQIKPGMTANVTIIADKRDSVLTVPERAVIEKTVGNKIVRILRSGKVVEVPIKTGLRGDDGSIEIIEGTLIQGETVVVFINTK